VLTAGVSHGATPGWQTRKVRIGLLWRAEWDPVDGSASVAEACKLHGMFAAFAALGIAAEPVVYSDETVDAVRDQLLSLDGVLVWVNPIEQGLDRSKLDPLLLEAAGVGVWVSAHPDVILKMGTKQVLADTQGMSWGTDTHVYRSADELREELPGRLGDGPVVLKQYRGMGGNGVWKVETAEGGLLVQHAVRDAKPEHVTLDEFATRCEGYFAGPGRMVEQPFQNRLEEGMIRVYLTHDRVVGFTHQYPRAFLPAGDGPPPKRFEPASAPAYQELKAQMESEWMPELRRILGLETHDLPVIWDADFLRGSDGRSVLCEINVSSTFAFPEHAMPTVAEAALARVREKKAAGQGFEPQLPVPETGVLPLDDPATGPPAL
jgi:hypothetical protein